VVTLAHVAVVSVGLLTSGARLGVLALVLLVAGCLRLLLARARDEGAGPVQRRRQTTRQVLSLVTLGVAAVTLVLLLSERVQTIVDFYRETLAAPESGVRSRAEVNLAFLNFDAATWLFGHGTGSASYGIQYVLADVEFASEGGYAAIVWELGVLGLVFYLVLAFQLSRIFVVPKAGSLQPWWRPVSAALGSLVLLELWVLNLLAAMLQQYVVAIVLWLFTGIALGLQARPGGDRGR
jgi:hypothetical protein